MPELRWRRPDLTDLVALLVLIVSGVVWAQRNESRITALEAESAKTQASHAAMMLKLEQIDSRIVELQVSLATEKSQQAILHRGQIPVER